MIEEEYIRYVNTPFDLLTDNKLSSTDKLIYLLLKSYCGKLGKCIARNKTLARHLNIGVTTISRSITHLNKIGWIDSKIIYKNNTKQVLRRDVIVFNFKGKNKYHKYLFSKKWKIISTRIKNRDNNKCTICKNQSDLQVHHLTYENIFNEKDEDLTTLCKDCHLKQH